METEESPRCRIFRLTSGALLSELSFSVSVDIEVIIVLHQVLNIVAV
jgi:hypothetical protein